MTICISNNFYLSNYTTNELYSNHKNLKYHLDFNPIICQTQDKTLILTIPSPTSTKSPMKKDMIPHGPNIKYHAYFTIKLLGYSCC